MNKQRGLFSDPSIQKAISGMTTAGGGVSPVCGTTQSAYAIQEKLVSTTGYWCVDNSGGAKPESAAQTAGFTA